MNIYPINNQTGKNMKAYVPTFNELLSAYQHIACTERIKNERPCESTVRNVVSGVMQICRTAGISGTDKISDLNRRKIDGYLAAALRQGYTDTTALTYLAHLKALTARWTRPYYEDRKWKVAPFNLPVCRRKPPRYIRPDREVLIRVRDWYVSLYHREDKQGWLAVTMMLEFAMRNGDVSRLRWSDFRIKNLSSVENPDEAVLCYTPQKTALTSGRIVAWPVHPDIWNQMRLIKASRQVAGDSELVIPQARKTFAQLNRELRTMKIFTGVKGVYELRKICIDHIYQKFGAELASSISGDDIRTVTRYYADPSAVHRHGIRIIDLL